MARHCMLYPELLKGLKPGLQRNGIRCKRSPSIELSINSSVYRLSKKITRSCIFEIVNLTEDVLLKTKLCTILMRRCRVV